MLSGRTLNKIFAFILLLFLYSPISAAAEVWVFYRPDIPLHVDTIQHLKLKTSQSLVFCPVGKTSFSFLESGPPEFAVALGDAALQLALTMAWKVKILVALVDQPTDDSRILFLDTQQPYAKQLKLLRTIVPNLEAVWYPYITERFAPGSALKIAAEKEGLKLISNRLDNPRVLPGALQALNQQKSAVIFPPDPLIMNNAIVQSIFLATFRSGTPVISFSEAMVKQGAAFAYTLSPENLAQTIAEIMGEAVEKRYSQKPVRAFDRWNLILNMTILEKFKLPLSDQIKESAFKLF